MLLNVGHRDSSTFHIRGGRGRAESICSNVPSESMRGKFDNTAPSCGLSVYDLLCGQTKLRLITPTICHTHTHQSERVMFWFLHRDWSCGEDNFKSLRKDKQRTCRGHRTLSQANVNCWLNWQSSTYVSHRTIDVYKLSLLTRRIHYSDFTIITQL